MLAVGLQSLLLPHTEFAHDLSGNSKPYCTCTQSQGRRSAYIHDLTRASSTRNMILSLAALAATAMARDIVFPPVSGMQEPLGAMGVTTGMDLTQAMYSGLVTYANLPYVHCLSGSEVEPYDIAIVGAPFDTGVTARPGARFGPNGIRQGSRRISP